MTVMFWVLAGIVFLALLHMAVTPRIPKAKPGEPIKLDVVLSAGQPIAVRDQHGRLLSGLTRVRYTATAGEVDTITLTCFADPGTGYRISGR